MKEGKLTEAEKKIVLDTLLSYPSGVSSRAWGHGPMAEPTRSVGVNGCFVSPREVAPEVVREYG